MDEDIRKKLHETLDTLANNYSENQYVSGRLVNYIENILLLIWKLLKNTRTA